MRSTFSSSDPTFSLPSNAELMQSDMAGPCHDHKKKDPPSWALIHLTGKPAVPRSPFDLFRSREGREVLGRRLLQFSCLRTLLVWSLGFLLKNCIGWNWRLVGVDNLIGQKSGYSRIGMLRTLQWHFNYQLSEHPWAQSSIGVRGPYFVIFCDS